jgi:ankyrin repeat protein
VLLLACLNGHIAVMQLLLDANADINVRNKVGRVSGAKAYNRLFRKRAFSFVQNGHTLLMDACVRGDTAVAQLLVEAKADLGAQTQVSNTVRLATQQ